MKASQVQIVQLKAAQTNAPEKDSAMMEFVSAARDSKEKTAPKPIKVKTSLGVRLVVLMNALSNVMSILLIVL